MPWIQIVTHAMLSNIRHERADHDDRPVARVNGPLLDVRASLIRVQGGDEVLNTHLPNSAPDVRKRSYQIETA
jgi:hypothetical protein